MKAGRRLGPKNKVMRSDPTLACPGVGANRRCDVVPSARWRLGDLMAEAHVPRPGDDHPGAKWSHDFVTLRTGVRVGSNGLC